MVPGDRDVARIVPGQRHLAPVAAPRGREVRRGGRFRNRRGGHGGPRAFTGSVLCAHRQGVLGAVDHDVTATIAQEDYGVFGGGRAAVTNGDEGRHAAVGAVVVPADREVVRIVPGKQNLAVTRRGHEARRRGGQSHRRCGGRGRCRTGDLEIGEGSRRRPHCEGVVGAVGQPANGYGRLIPRSGLVRIIRNLSVGAGERRPDRITGDPGVARVPLQHDPAFVRHRHQTGRRRPQGRGSHAGRRAGTGIVHRAHRQRVLGAVGQAGHGGGGGGRAAALDIDEVRAAVGADLVFGDRVVVRIGPSERNLLATRRGREIRRGVRHRRRRGDLAGGQAGDAGRIHRPHREGVFGAVGQGGNGGGRRVPRSGRDVQDLRRRAAAGGLPMDPIMGDQGVARIPLQYGLAVARLRRQIGRCRPQWRGGNGGGRTAS